MVRYRRNFVPGGTFFFTVALADRQSTLLIDHVSILRHSFRKARSERSFTIEAIVVLPDHLHAILTLPEGDADFSHRWRRIKTVFTRRLLHIDETIARRDNTGRVLWQRRFWEHTIQDESDFARHVDYIHINPAKHGLVSNPSDWPHSSLHRFIRQGMVASSWGYQGGREKPCGEPKNHVASENGPPQCDWL